MQSIISSSLVFMLILQQILVITMADTSKENSHNENRRFVIARRLRAPLMGRSITVESNEDVNHDVDKRRYGLTLLNRKKWMNLKRKGPLFG